MCPSQIFAVHFYMCINFYSYSIGTDEITVLTTIRKKSITRVEPL